MDYQGYTKEELEFLLDNENEIETGCEINCDDCLNEELKLIKLALEKIT